MREALAGRVDLVTAPRRVEFDGQAMHLLSAVPGPGPLCLQYGVPRLPGLLTLHVTPDVPAGPVLLVFGSPGGTLHAHCRAVPLAVSMILRAITDATGRQARCHFPWARGVLPVVAGPRALPAQVRDLLRRAEPDPYRRPIVQLDG